MTTTPEDDRPDAATTPETGLGKAPEPGAGGVTDVTDGDVRPDPEPGADIRQDIPALDPDWPQTAVGNESVEG